MQEKLSPSNPSNKAGITSGRAEECEAEFYFDLVHHLIKHSLDDAQAFYQVQISARNRCNQHRLSQAINKAIRRDDGQLAGAQHIRYNCAIVRSRDTPELSVVDYMLWALRYIIRGERRFYQALQAKYRLINDLYDFEKIYAGAASDIYTPEDPFSVEIASPFLSDGYV